MLEAFTAAFTEKYNPNSQIYSQMVSVTKAVVRDTIILEDSLEEITFRLIGYRAGYPGGRALTSVRDLEKLPKKKKNLFHDE